MKKACNVYEVQEGASQEIADSGDDVERKTAPETDPTGIKQRYPDWWWGKQIES